MRLATTAAALLADSAGDFEGDAAVGIRTTANWAPR